MRKIHIYCYGVILSLCLAIFVCFVSNNLRTRFENRGETIRQQIAILSGKSYYISGRELYLPVLQSRILFPALLKSASCLHVFSINRWYGLLRLATAFLAFFTFWYLLSNFAKTDCKVAGFGMILLAYGLIFTFNHGWDAPTDFIDVIFFSLFLFASFYHRRFLLWLLVIIASANHQTAAFAGIIWFFLHGVTTEFKKRIYEIFYAAFLIISSYATVIIINYLLTGKTMIKYEIKGDATITQIKSFLHNPNPSSWPVLLFAMFTPLILWIAINRHFLTSEHRRLLAASLIIVLISAVMAFMAELRSVFLAPMVIITYIATAAEARARINN